jgi:AraC family transcriptional regulator of adaptative response / DNA-3-methyladenine glycosylase II
LGVPGGAAMTLASLAKEVASGRLRLVPHCDLTATHQALLAIGGMSRQSATTIVMRSLYWPDAFNPSDSRLQRAAGVSTASGLSAVAEQWRPWRAYAAEYLRSAVS